VIATYSAVHLRELRAASEDRIHARCATVHLGLHLAAVQARYSEEQYLLFCTLCELMPSKREITDLGNVSESAKAS
jgi:hypothetical protein